MSKQRKFSKSRENFRDGKSLCKKHSYECGKLYVHGTGQTLSLQQYGNLGGAMSKEEFTAAQMSQT